MITSYPTEEELRNRITRQLEWRDSSDTVALIWHGYLTALLEWGLIEVPIFDRLTDLLPRVGNKELCELSMGVPLTTELEREIDDSLQPRPNSQS